MVELKPYRKTTRVITRITIQKKQRVITPSRKREKTLVDLVSQIITFSHNFK
jgi:hypothetical protein